MILNANLLIMEANKDLTIRLIQADLKHNQLITALESIHLNTNGRYLINLMDVVAELMGIEGEKSDQWFTIYDSYMEHSYNYRVEDRGDNLLPVAEDCYNHLAACLQVEQKVREAEQRRGQL